jgi:hypothetical protein
MPVNMSKQITVGSNNNSVVMGTVRTYVCTTPNRIPIPRNDRGILDDLSIGRYNMRQFLY